MVSRPLNQMALLLGLGLMLGLVEAHLHAREKTPEELAAEIARRAEQCLGHYQRLAARDTPVPTSAFSGLMNHLHQQLQSFVGFNWAASSARSNPRLISATREIATRLQAELRALGIESRLERRRKLTVLQITNIPEGFWLGRVLRSVRPQEWPDGRRGLELEYNPLLDLVPRTTLAMYLPPRRAVELNAANLVAALADGRTTIVLHEVGHDRQTINLLRLLEELPVGTRSPVSIHTADIVRRGEANLPFNKYEDEFSLEEMLNWRRDVGRGLALRRQAQAIQTHFGQDVLDTVVPLEGANSFAGSINLRNEARTLLQFSQTLETLLETRLRQPLTHTFDRRSERMGVPLATVHLNATSSIRIPVPVELVGTDRIDAYVRDFLERTLQEARADRAYADRAMTQLGDN